MSDIVERLRGIYRQPVNDGAGQLNGSSEFVRQFTTPPIQHDAATEIETLRAQVSALEAKIANTTFWQECWHPEGGTAEQVQAELQDYRMILDEVNKVYYEITGGRFAKQNTAAEHIISRVQELQDEAVREAVEEAEEAKDAVIEVLREALGEAWALQCPENIVGHKCRDNTNPRRIRDCTARQRRTCIALHIAALSQPAPAACPVEVSGDE